MKSCVVCVKMRSYFNWLEYFLSSVIPRNRFSVAPMLDWTDRHCRYFHRLLTAHSLLYTEMVTTGAILQGKNDYLAFNDEEHPVSLQLGGADPAALAACAKLAEARGYDEINLNVGCPSDRVQNGLFGACLMAMPDRVADCLDAMRSVVSIPITLKTRIGIDEQDSYDFLCHFIETVMPLAQTYIIHARKAWLKGLNPKENREIPPLDYARVYQLKKEYPQLTIVINGGIKDLQEVKRHLQFVDGVMMGREAYQNPGVLTHVDALLFGDTRSVMSKKETIRALYPYIEKSLSNGSQLNHIMRHTLGFFNGCRGAKSWRRYLSEHAHQPGADCIVVENALALVEESNIPINA